MHEMGWEAKKSPTKIETQSMGIGKLVSSHQHTTLIPHLGLGLMLKRLPLLWRSLGDQTRSWKGTQRKEASPSYPLRLKTKR